MKWKVLLVCTLCFAIVSCGEKAKEMKEAMDNVKALSENADKISDQSNELEKRRKDRAAKGDTLAIPYQELEKYLPENIGGYKAEAPKGESVSMIGMSYSVARRNFTKDNGDNVEIELFDYNQTPMLYQGIAITANMKVDNDNETMQGYDLKQPYSSAIEHFYKQDKRAEITAALGGRFILTVKANNQSSTDMVKGVVNSMKLSDMANK